MPGPRGPQRPRLQSTPLLPGTPPPQGALEEADGPLPPPPKTAPGARHTAAGEPRASRPPGGPGGGGRGGGTFPQCRADGRRQRAPRPPNGGGSAEGGRCRSFPPGPARKAVRGGFSPFFLPFQAWQTRIVHTGRKVGLSSGQLSNAGEGLTPR